MTDFVGVNSTDSYFYTVIDKESKYHSEIEVEGSSEILKAFVTKDSALLADIEKQLLNHEATPEEIAKAEHLLKKETSTIGLEEHISFKKKEIKNDNKPEISNNSTFYFVGLVIFGIFLFIIGIILGRKYCKMGKKDNIYNYKKEILYELRSY